MTRQRIDSHSTEFGLWLRKQPVLSSTSFDCQNLDYVWFAYRDSWLITIEEKRYGSSSSLAQSDTHNLIKQMLKVASGYEYQTLRGKRKIYYLGHYLVQFENTNPDDSKWIKINGQNHDKYSLLLLLRTGCLSYIVGGNIHEMLKNLQVTIKNIDLSVLVSILTES